MFEAFQLFGGGWTGETIDRIAGWKCKAVNPRLCVIGRAGKPGAVSVQVSRDQVDVAIYDDLTGPEVLKALKAGHLRADEYKQETPTPGWFLKYIDSDGNLLI